MSIDFLTTIVSTNGWNCITAIRPFYNIPNKTWGQNYPIKFSDAESTMRLITDLQRGGVETYFALGAFAISTPDGKDFREQKNVHALKAFWLDIDAGDKKYAKHGEAVYQTQQLAVDGLNAVIAQGKLPQPTYVISSGEGLHVYWCSTEDISPAEWLPAAAQLGSYCASVGLKVDTSRTQDTASILRPIGTTHFSSGKPVYPLAVGTLFTKQDLLNTMLSLPAPQVLNATYQQPSALSGGINPAVYASIDSSMGSMGDYQASSFGKIIEKQQYERTGCQQLLYAYEHQAELAEPDWFHALSVAAFCATDRDEWIHKLSHLHPQYERGETERKAMQAKGPTPCRVFEMAAPERCKGCPHYGKITNPIVLGYQPQNRPTIVVTPISADRTQTDTFLVPELPFGFFRKPEGGVYTHVPKLLENGKESKDEMMEFTVCPQDVYMFERVNDRGIKQLYLCRYHSPHDGVIEFQLDSSIINTPADFRNTITGAGLPIDGRKRWELLMTFFNRQRTNLIGSRAAVTAVEQMGWQENGNDFVLGDTVITRTGTRPAPLNEKETARKYAKAFRPSSKGAAADEQMSDWRAILQAMYGDDRAIANQFVIATAMGAPFSAKYALESHAGGVISLSSSGSGRGKTFTCQTAMRVFGDPTATTFSSKDGTTIAAMMTNLGYLNSVPLLRDEVTEMTSDEVISMVYDSTRLGDKERAQGSDNDIRAARNKWRTFFYATANTSLYDMITMHRDVADGPMRRVTEIQIPTLDYLHDNDYARQLAKRISAIRGVAGYELLTWLVNNNEQAQGLWEKTMSHFIKAHNVTNEERYWVNHLVSGSVGALIGEQLGLLPFTANKVIKFAGELLTTLRGRVGYRTIQQEDYLPQFFTDNLEHTLVIGAAVSDDTTQTGAEPPRKAVYIRTEAANKMVYINPFIIKKWCASRKIVMADFEHQLRLRGGTPNFEKRMLANTQYVTTDTPHRVWAVPTP